MAADWMREVGDTYPLEATLSSDGAPANLSAALTVKVRFGSRSALRDAVIDNAVAGEVSFQLEAGDVSSPRTIQIQWVVTWPNGPLTYPPGRAMKLEVGRGIKPD